MNKPLKKISSKQVAEIHTIKTKLRKHSLNTVCEEAHCPNLGECFARGTATFMILGNVCTRSCKFCAVKSGEKPQPVDPNEPESVAKMVSDLKLKHVVITSVTRDDLLDEGAWQFAATINKIRGNCGDVTIEVLTPDFNGRPDCLRVVCSANPDIFNHNIETVKRLTPLVRSHAQYDRSLRVLNWVAINYPSIVVKSGIMVGLGETKEEIIETLKDLKKAGCKIVTIGQYLSPNKEKLKVERYLSEEEFNQLKELGEGLGINHVFSGQFVRSSYMAEMQTLNSKY